MGHQKEYWLCVSMCLVRCSSSRVPAFWLLQVMGLVLWGPPIFSVAVLTENLLGSGGGEDLRTWQLSACGI